MSIIDKVYNGETRRAHVIDTHDEVHIMTVYQGYIPPWRAGCTETNLHFAGWVGETPDLDNDQAAGIGEVK